MMTEIKMQIDFAPASGETRTFKESITDPHGSPDDSQEALANELFAELRKAVSFHESKNTLPSLGQSLVELQSSTPITPTAATAKHCIQEIINAGSNTVQLRVNFKDGLVGLVSTRTMDWKFHQDPAVDVAVLQRELPTDFDHLGWGSRMFYDDPERFRYLREPPLGIGDDIFVIGLFSQRTGKAKNIPIVRMGNVAAMPDDSDKINTEQGAMSAYLIETHSMGCFGSA